MRPSLFKNIQYCHPNFWHSCLLLLIMLICGVLLDSVIMLFISLVTGRGLLETCSNPSLAALNFAIPFVPVLVWLIIYGGYRKKAGAEAIPYNIPDFGELGAGKTLLLLFPLTLSTALLLDPLNMLIGASEEMQKAFELQLSSFWGVLSIVALAPLFEEFLMRGTIARGIFISCKSPLAGILLSALLFGALHLNLWQAIPAMLIGIIMAWIYYRTGSLWCTIFMHFINNTLSTILYFAIPENTMESSLYDIIPQKTYIICYAVSAAAVVAIIYYLNKSLPKAKDKWRRKDSTR